MAFLLQAYARDRGAGEETLRAPQAVPEGTYTNSQAHAVLRSMAVTIG